MMALSYRLRARARALQTSGRLQQLRASLTRALFSDPRFEPIIDRSAAVIAALIADLAAILGLDRVAIGGGIGFVHGYLNSVLELLAAEPELFRPTVMPAELGHDSGMMGAMLLAAESIARYSDVGFT